MTDKEKDQAQQKHAQEVQEHKVPPMPTKQEWDRMTDEQRKEWAWEQLPPDIDSASGIMSFWMNKALKHMLKRSKVAMDRLRPFIKAELEKPEYEGITLENLFDADDAGDAEASTLLDNILQAAWDERDKTISSEGLSLLKSSGPPPKHTMANSYISNELQHGGIIDAGQLNLPVLGDGRKAHKGGELITTSVIATYQPGEGVNIQGSYTEYDRQVQDAIGSMLLYGGLAETRIFDSAMVFRAMTNTTGKPSAQQKGAITKSIEKQRRIHVQVDASTEFERRGITDEYGKPIRFKVGDFLLSVKDIEAKAGGKNIRGYYIKDEPLLLTYSKLTGQLLTVKAEVLDIRRIDRRGSIGQSIPNTESRIAIKGYLLRRIEVMKHDIQRAKDKHRKYESRRRGKPELPKKEVSEFRQQSTRILFDTIFAETGTNTTVSTDTQTGKEQTKPASRDTQMELRNYAKQCLDYWAAIGHIQGYTIVKGAKNSIRGIEITV